MEATTFVHLTDLHISNPDQPDDHLLSDTTANLRAILAEVRDMRPQPEFIVVSGDLTNHGNVEAFAHLKSIWEAEAPAGIPVLWTLGNHDTRPGYWQVMEGRSDNLEARVDRSEVVAGTHIILLDTSRPGYIGGHFGEGQLAWLEAELAAHPAQRKLIVMHHAPALDSDDADMEWEALNFADTEQLRALLAGRSDILGILSGHIHMDRVAHWHGIPVVVGIGQHNSVDVVRLGTHFNVVQGSSFIIGQIRDSGLSVMFAPQPSDRQSLRGGSLDDMKSRIRSYEAALLARVQNA